MFLIKRGQLTAEMGNSQLIKTLEKIHFGKINTAFLLEGSQSADHLPPTFIRLPHCGLLLD